MKPFSDWLLNNPSLVAPDDLHSFVNHIEHLMPLLDQIPNMVFFIKDINAQYVLFNKTLLNRSKHTSKQEVVGLKSIDIFFNSQASQYTQQDLQVLNGKYITNKLELHNYVSGQLGWCLTHKIPIYNKQQTIIGMAGMSVDIEKDTHRQLKNHARLGKVVDFIGNNIGQKITVSQLAKDANLSTSQLERLFKSVLNLSPLQVMQKIRLDFAIQLLVYSQLPITEIATHCGYADHSAFSRQFKQMTGLTPIAFRQKMRA